MARGLHLRQQRKYEVKTMTLKQILYVRAVSKAGSIGKAAESLFISQSSLSESIRNLEREYGMVLFERTSKGISLTRLWESYMRDLNVKYGYDGQQNKNRPGGLPMLIDTFTPRPAHAHR